MFTHSKLQEAMELYEKQLLQESERKNRMTSLPSMSKEKEEQIYRFLRRHQRTKLLLSVAKQAAKGLAVAAVFCIMAYAVYLAAQGPKDPIVAATGETETKTETVTSETTKTESETETQQGINPNHAKALNFQEKKILEELQAKKRESKIKYKEFLSELLRVTTESARDVWSRSNATNALNEDILFTPYYGPTARKIVFSVLLEVAEDEDWEFANWIIKEFEGKIKNPLAISRLNSETGKMEELDYFDYLQQYYKLKANSFFQNAVNLMVKKKYPAGGYREFLRIEESDYNLIEPYTVDGITATADNFMDLFEEKTLEYQKDPDFWKKLKHGDIVYFGRYEQDGIAENGPEAIQWIVFPHADGKALSLVSIYSLEVMPWDSTPVEEGWNSWADSDVRAWLNGEFYQEAFEENERNRILQTHLENDWNYFDEVIAGYRGTGGPDTEDYVYLYSVYDDHSGLHGKYQPDPYNNQTVAAKQKSEKANELYNWYRGVPTHETSDDFYSAEVVREMGLVLPVINITLD